MRVEAGAVIDEFELPGVGQVVARLSRVTNADGVSWAAMFTLLASGVNDLALVHRLSAPTLADARTAVRGAIEFLAGCAPGTIGLAEQAASERAAAGLDGEPQPAPQRSATAEQVEISLGLADQAGVRQLPPGHVSIGRMPVDRTSGRPGRDRITPGGAPWGRAPAPQR